ncbi:hypothetical protein [Treponema sp.]|uniref:hypothetical protein n=1 Tax=Treponema sp. TaxID=166 RepID=UPI0025FACC46|nr:hypothetical protein [Treponema sp.]MCR5218512.1 hypothetical protein [Treponema sp.]
MKANEWFAVIPFEKTDILIPQSYIGDFSFSGIAEENTSMPLFYIDKYFYGHKTEESKYSSLLIKCPRPFFIKTASLPEIKQLSLKTFSFPPALMKNKLQNMGCMAVSFENNRLQVIIDPERIRDTLSLNEDRGDLM